MTPEELAAWAQAASVLIQVGAAAVTDVKGWIAQQHPTLSPEQLAAAYAALEADDGVRAAIAAQAAGQA